MTAAFFKNRLLQVFLAALALRLGFLLLAPQPAPVADALDYDTIAVNLATGHGFSLNPDVPTPRRAPGYPFFLAAVYYVFGHAWLPVRLLQALLGALTCLLAFRTAERLFGERAGPAAGWLLALYPPLVPYAGLLLTETLFTFLLAAAAMFWVYGAERKSPWDFALAGLCLGLATLTRPVTLFFPALLLLAAALRPGLARLWPALLVAFLLALAPWSARNYRLWGTLKPASVGTGYGFFVTGNMAAGRSFDESFRAYMEKFRAYPEPQAFTPGAHPALALEQELQAEGNALLKAHPAAFLKIALKRLPSFWLSSHSSVFGVDRSLPDYRAEGAWGAIAARLGLLLLQAALVWLALLGLWQERARWREAAPLALLLAFFTAHVLFDFVPRYHLPVIPQLLVFSAAGLLAVLDRRRGRA